MTEKATQPLYRALLANALFSTVSAFFLAFRAEDLVAPLGGVPTGALYLVAGLLLCFVALLGGAASQVSRPRPRFELSLVAVTLDALWVLGSIVALMLVGRQMSLAGVGLVVGVACVVALLTRLQWRGLSRSFAETDRRMRERRRTEHRVAISHEVGVPASRFWSVLADLESVSRYLPGLTESRVEGTAGVGARRTCVNERGEKWSEEVLDWKPGRSMSLRFVSEAPDFPYPLDPMVGGWQLEEMADDRCRVTVWWSLTVRPRWLAPLVVPLVEITVRRDMKAAVEAMATAARSSCELGSAA